MKNILELNHKEITFVSGGMMNVNSIHSVTLFCVVLTTTFSTMLPIFMLVGFALSKFINAGLDINEQSLRGSKNE